MAASELEGYIINKLNFKDYDEIITFLTNDNKTYTCISLGSRKTASKNGRNLFIGNYCKFEIFLARNDEKMSRLKKATAIDTIDWRLEMYRPFNVLNECVYKTENSNLLFAFYKNLLEAIKNNQYGEEHMILIILHKFCILNGISLHVSSCVECNSNHLKTINFKKRGMVCNLHFNPQYDHLYSLNESKLIYELFSNNYEKMSIYAAHFNFIIKCLKQYIEDNLGIKLISLNIY